MPLYTHTKNIALRILTKNRTFSSFGIESNNQTYSSQVCMTLKFKSNQGKLTLYFKLSSLSLLNTSYNFHLIFYSSNPPFLLDELKHTSFCFGYATSITKETRRNIFFDIF